MDYISKITSSPIFKKVESNRLSIGLGLIAFIMAKRILGPYLALRRQYLSQTQLQTLKNNFIARRQKQIDLVKSLISSVSQEKQQLIVNTPSLEIVNNIKNGKYTCEEVFLTFAYRSATIGMEYNLICDIDVENNLEIAKQKDEILRTTQDKSTLPRFFGLPITVKEHLKTKGLLASCGYVQLAGKPVETSDCAFVQLLREEGAIPFASTNVPQGLFAIEANNNLYGRSLNPLNKQLTVGGSSGGEGGAQVARISAFGIGSDSLGSARIPAAFCGVYSFKGTGKRLSIKGRLGLTGSEVGGFKDIQTSIGPISQHIDDLIEIERAVLGRFNNLDDDAPPLIWDQKLFEETSLKKVKIGVIRSLKNFPNVAGIENVMNETVEKLKSLGCQVHEIDQDLPFVDMQDSISRLLATPGVQLIIFKMLRGDKPLDIHSIYLKIKLLPLWLNSLRVKLLEMRGKPREADFIKLQKSNDFMGHVMEQLRLETIKKQIQKYIKENEIDVIISPVLPFTAISHDDGGDLLPFLGLPGIANVLDLPAGVVPIRNVTKEEADSSKYKDLYEDRFSGIIRRTIDNSENMPLSIQVASNTWKDESEMQAKEVEALITKNYLFPYILNLSKTDKKVYELIE